MKEGIKVTFEFIDPESGDSIQGISEVFDVFGVPIQVKHPITQQPSMSCGTFLLIAINNKLQYVPSENCTILCEGVK